MSGSPNPEAPSLFGRVWWPTLATIIAVLYATGTVVPQRTLVAVLWAVIAALAFGFELLAYRGNMRAARMVRFCVLALLVAAGIVIVLGL